MLTYNDLVAVGQGEQNRMQFVRQAIDQHKSSRDYKIAVDADLYDRKQNPDMAKLQKVIYTVTGRKIPDTYSSNWKMGRCFFPLFIVQQVQFLLGNGVTWKSSGTVDRLGTSRYPFDNLLQKAAHIALVQKCSFGFWNNDHLDIFEYLEFVPLMDENNGALRAGIRFWQIDPTKPLRATLYEEDGYTDYIWSRRDERGNVSEHAEVMHDKRPYKIKSIGAKIDPEKIYIGENYPTFPIVPFWGNKNKQSEIVGLQEKLFAYDAIMSGFCNTVEDASSVFWAFTNSGGMDEQALAEFLERVRRLHVALTDETGSTATPQQLETPYQARTELLDQLEKSIYKDAMAFDSERVASGAATATEIRAAYDNLEMKCNDFEYCVIDFINGILDVAGIKDEKPTFTRSKNVNVAEEIQTVMVAASALDDEYVTRKILALLGDGDQAEEVIKRRIADEQIRQNAIDVDTDGNQSDNLEGDVA